MDVRKAEKRQQRPRPLKNQSSLTRSGGVLRLAFEALQRGCEGTALNAGRKRAGRWTKGDERLSYWYAGIAIVLYEDTEWNGTGGMRGA